MSSQRDSRTEHAEARIILADDDVLLREGVGSLLERAGFEVAGSVGTAEELLKLVRSCPPELVIVDIRMPPGHSTEGLEAAEQIRREFPDVGVLVLSAHVEVDQAMDLMASGRRVGYLLKSRVVDVDGFIETIRRILHGGSVVDPAVVQELVRSRRRPSPLQTLTEREREVLSLMAEGYSNAGIAHSLWVSEGTIEKHVRSILSKLQLSDTPDDHRRVLAVLTFLESR
ncbi:MAG TPA: response regulator transcription factor [Acidimicrobiales bacterium]|nr:response regulator transcription factor [Acidimicrobiales bacterium]